ncbi:MAG: NPCBM/NEW2 domain-containing protein, partial [Acidobacteriota bacterium]
HTRPTLRLGFAFVVSALTALLTVACGGKETATSPGQKPGVTKVQAAPPAPTAEPYPTNFSPGKSTVGEILITSIDQDFARPQINKNLGGQALSIGGKKYETGVGTHANSRMTITFPAGFRTLTGACGLDDDVEKGGSVVFRILSRDKVLYRSPLLKGKQPAASAFSVNVTGLTELTLVVDDAGDGINADHGDWVALTLNK